MAQQPVMSTPEALAGAIGALGQRLTAAETARGNQLMVAEERVNALEARTTELTTELALQQGKLSETIAQLQTKFAELNRQYDALAVLAGGREARDSSQIVDLKGLGKPDNFHGEATKWRDWKFKFLAYMSCVSRPLGELMTSWEDQEISHEFESLTEEHKVLSTKLSYVLILICKDKDQHV